MCIRLYIGANPLEDCIRVPLSKSKSEATAEVPIEPVITNRNMK
jgi:hypothetical protein